MIAATLKPCATCGEETYNDSLCRECGIDEAFRQSTCTKCQKFMGNEHAVAFGFDVCRCAEPGLPA